MEKDIEVLAKTLFGEARGEGVEGIEAVANVVMNRFKSKKWFSGKTIALTCKKPLQFSCWNEGDPNKLILEKDLSGDVIYQVCERIATRAAKGLLSDNTNGATHYHVNNISPSWSKGKVPCVVIGRHLFYKDID